ncbi:MAG: 3-isopropylmalate dehydrogenase [Acidobacteria bacterium]|nr:3-isopropylmalate dehydrogenase [Acidobacteriota bacterium]
MQPTESWSECIEGRVVPAPRDGRYLVGVLEGEGVGPEVVRAALRVLSAVESVSSLRFELRFGGPIGIAAQRCDGVPLTPGVVAFCEEIFARGGAILAGPGGGRFVYDLRRRFDLFCKISPVSTFPELAGAGRLKPEHVRGVDCLLVRENAAGIYQGAWREETLFGTGRVAHHEFSYSEPQVRRIVETAARLAARRRGRLAVVLKDHGIPTVSALWRDVAREAVNSHGIDLEVVNADYAAYRLVQNAQEFDVLVTSNLLGDMLIDLAGVLLGSRALACSGNFAHGVPAVYQTNHGSAHDLAGTGRANPFGQVFSLAMLLRESFGLVRAAALVECAVRAVWRDGWRTEDIAEPGTRAADTRLAGELTAAAVGELAHEIEVA